MSVTSEHPSWDRLRAEMLDSIHQRRAARRKAPCRICGKFTRSLYRICCDHPLRETTEGD